MFAVPAARAQEAQDGPAGTDDGFAVSIQCSGDFGGNLEPCGCEVPLGGIAWRSGYAKAVATLTKNQAAIVQVDAGHAFLQEPLPGRVRVENVSAKTEWVLRAFDLIHVQAANVSPYDLAYLKGAMATAGYEERVKQFPVLDRFVSANVTPADDKTRPFKPYVVVEAASPRLGAKPLRVGFLGLSEVPPEGAAINGYKISDPVAAARKYYPEVRAKSDLVVLLVYGDPDLLSRLEPSLPGVDALLAAHKYPRMKTVPEVTPPVYVYVADQTKFLGELRLYPAQDPKKGPVARYLHLDIPLGDTIAADPDAVKLAADARKAYSLQ